MAQDTDMPTHPDRAVQALIDHGWTGEWDWEIGPYDLAAGVALVLRVVRDDLIMSWQAGTLRNVLDVERAMNARIEALTGQTTTTGDTTTASANADNEEDPLIPAETRERLARYLCVTDEQTDEATRWWDEGEISTTRKDGYRAKADEILAAIAGKDT